jgi:1,2-dihydroxy-3-keto-5-methylthiopentene dioxygenase
LPHFASNDPALITSELAQRGIGFERWPARAELPAGAGPEQVLAAYASEIAQVQQQGRYPTVDAIRMEPDHPEREALRRKFLAEHTHSEDEVRFFVEGKGLFCLHIGEEVLQVLCEADDWIDMGSAPQFCAIRFFDNADGWVAQFTGDDVADQFPLLD